MIARARSGSTGDLFKRNELSEAAGELARAGREARVRAAGVRYLDHALSPLAAEDWMKLRIYENDTLEDPNHDLRAFRVRIIRVVVDARDVRTLIENSSATTLGRLPTDNAIADVSSAPTSTTPTKGQTSPAPPSGKDPSQRRRPKAEPIEAACKVVFSNREALKNTPPADQRAKIRQHWKAEGLGPSNVNDEHMARVINALLRSGVDWKSSSDIGGDPTTTPPMSGDPHNHS